MDRKVKKLLKGAGLERLVGGALPDSMKQRAIENKQQARTLEEANYQAWLKEHGYTDKTAGLTGDEALGSRSADPIYQMYRREQEAKGQTTEALSSKASAEVEQAKKKVEEFKTRKLGIKDTMAFGLPRDATLDQLIAAVDAARQKGELTQNQRNYGSPIVDSYRHFKAVAERSAEQGLAEQQKGVEANRQAELRRLGLQEGATPEQIAEARGQEAKTGMEKYIVDRDRRQKVSEWEVIQRQENQRIEEALKNVRKELQAKLTDDKIDNIPIQVAFKELVNGEILRKQIYRLQGLAYENDMETPEEYVEAVNSGKLTTDRNNGNQLKPIEIFDAEKATQEYQNQLESQVNFIDKVGHYGRVGSILLADIAAEALPYIMPAFGTALSLGWKAFAPEGSMNYKEGTVGQKFGRLGLSIVEEGAKKLIGLGREKRRKMMEKMMDDEVELHGGRGQASGFVMRMMAENKKKHKGQYRNPSTNDYGSSMKSFRAFDLAKMETPSKFLKEHFSGEPVPFVSKRAEKKAEDTALASIRASKMSQADAKKKMEEARKKIGEKPQYQILYNAFRRYVSV